MKKPGYIICFFLSVLIAQSSLGQDAATIMMNQQMNNQAGLMNIRNMQRTFDAQNEASKRSPAGSHASATSPAGSATSPVSSHTSATSPAVSPAAGSPAVSPAGSPAAGSPAVSPAGSPAAGSPVGSPPTSSSSRVAPTSRISSLKVDHDRAVSKELRDQYIGNIEKTEGKEIAGKTDKFFGDIQTTFGKMVSPFGLRQDNYADVLAAYLVVMWMSINKQTELPAVAKVQAVRSQCLSSLSSGGIAPLSDRQRQMVAETLMYQACSAVTIREKAVQTGDSKLLTRLAEQSAFLLSREGINLSHLTLTDKGLTKL